jgi:hypothetical protein
MDEESFSIGNHITAATILVPFSLQSISPDSTLFSTGIPGRVFLVL